MPVISIIVPVYQIERYILSCIESLLNQSYKNIQIILVDDGSSDKSSEICDKYSQIDQRITVIHQNNVGLSCARNVGIDSSQGEFICFVDGDDLVSSSYCHTLLQVLEESEAQFSICGVCRFKDGTSPAPLISSTEISLINSNEYLKKQLNRQSEFGVWNKLFRRDIFKKLRFADGRIHEDVIFSADLLKLQCKVVMTSQQLYFYRQRNTGIVAKGSKHCSPDRVYAGKYLVETSKKVCPELFESCLKYAVEYPFMFVDGIYVHHTFRENKGFLNELQRFIRSYDMKICDIQTIPLLVRRRMRLFSKSRFLYGFNAYARLIRVYLFRIVRKDAYADGHGI